MTALRSLALASWAADGPMITVAVLPAWPGQLRRVRVERLVLSPGACDRPAWTPADSWTGTLDEWRAAVVDVLASDTDEDAGEVAHG